VQVRTGLCRSVRKSLHNADARAGPVTPRARCSAAKVVAYAKRCKKYGIAQRLGTIVANIACGTVDIAAHGAAGQDC